MEKDESIKDDKSEESKMKKKIVKKSRTMLLIAVTTALLVAIVVYFIIPKNIQNEDNKSISTSPKSSFLFKTIKGQTFKINASSRSFEIPKMKNKIVFLKVFGWDCKYCKKEIPELIKLKEQFDGAFDIIAIESQHHTTKENLKFVKEHGINYHIVTGDKYERFLNYLKEHHGWSGVIPLSIIIGEDSKILAFEVGSKSYTLAELLKVSLQQYKMIRELQKR